MKKNFNVNIGGIIFHMDEDAYEKLSAYLENLKHHFAHTEGRDEILLDIENRISEMLQAKLSDEKQVIVNEDIEKIIATLGQPSEWGEESSSSEPYKHHRPKKLYRDTDNKVIAGVCSGLASYFNIDVVWLRVLFIVVTLAGFGIGIIAYLLLWLLAPEARTTAEKLEMKGEKVTISNIEKSIKEEFEGIKGGIHNLKDETKTIIQQGKRKGSNFFEKLFYLFLQVLTVVFKIIVVFFGLMFMAVGLFLLVGFLISFIDGGHEVYISTFGISAFSLPAILRLVLESREQTLAIIGLILVVGIPLILLIYFGARLLFRFKYRSRFIGIPAFSLILAGLVICTIVGVQIFKSFSQKAVDQNVYTLQPLNAPTIIVDTRLPEGDTHLLSHGDDFIIGNWNLYSAGDTTLFFGVPSLEVIPSDNDSLCLVVYSIAKGETHEKAKARAKNIRYKFEQNDSVLTIDPYFYMPVEDKIRGQEVKLVLKIPRGRTLKFRPDTWIFNEHHFNYDLPEYAGKQYIMTDQGLRELHRAKTIAVDSLQKPL
jgi:phage shock protein PspC (stress-responsive transcriptional regulator)